MVNWKTFKGEGPWPFQKQPDKWGYLNNPRWANPARAFVPGGPDDYSGRESEEPQIWTLPNGAYSRNTQNRHHQCGHWHGGVVSSVLTQYLDLDVYRFWQQSIDTYKGSIAIGAHRFDSPYGYTVLIYEGGQWYSLGAFIGAYGFMSPYTLRMNDNSVAVFGTFFIDSNPDDGMLGVVVFPKDDFPRQSAVWRTVWPAPSDVFDETATLYNGMDLQGSRMACVAKMYQIGGVVNTDFQMKVSYDEGMTWPTAWIFPGGAVASDNIRIRMSEDGIVWVVIDRHTTKHLELWKSNAAATSCTKIWDYDYSGDVGLASSINYQFDISEADAQYITIKVNATSFGGVGNRYIYSVIYQSTNYGVGFSKTTHMYPFTYPPVVYGPDTLYERFTANGQYVVAGADSGFQRSVNYGVNFSTIAPPHVLDEYYVDQQKYGSDIVYTQCSASFSPPGADPDVLGLLFSSDNGATWEVIQSPLMVAAHTDPVLIQSYPGIYITNDIPNNDVTINPGGGLPTYTHDLWTSVEIVPGPRGNGVRQYNVLHWENSWSY